MKIINLFKILIFFIISTHFVLANNNVPKPIGFIIENNVEALSQWIKSNGDVNYAIGNMPIVMFTVYEECRFDSLKLLLEKGVSPNTKGELDISLLHMASDHTDTSCLQLLISEGASLDSIDEYHRTAYYYAMMSDNKKAIDILYKKGLSLFIKDKLGFDVIHTSIVKDKHYLFKNILEALYEAS